MILSGHIALPSVGFINFDPLFFFCRVGLHSHPPQTLLGLAHGCLWWHVFILVGPSYGHRQMFVLSTPFLLFPGLPGACVSSMLVLQHSHGLMCWLFRLYIIFLSIIGVSSRIVFRWSVSATLLWYLRRWKCQKSCDLDHYVNVKLLWCEDAKIWLYSIFPIFSCPEFLS